ncbi:DUF1758 domain-containing protein [Nephila pilipes]|uniref:DUF1758 domain-containing protein n=1 Tax=Nephila pilipes TaxID=299642 RepID=A0A8X6N5S5_NEPPI|nr:DUF1758 domain-containing protein [Nephila pilipes]
MATGVRDQNLINELKLRGIELTDIGEENPPIKLLLCGDVLRKFLTGRIEVIKSGISAIETKLQWSVLGSQKKNALITVISLSLPNFTIPDMWDLDSLGTSDSLRENLRSSWKKKL